MTFTSVFSTGLHADCVRFLPESCGNEQEIAVFSCYELDEKIGKRLGKLILAENMKDNQVRVVQSIPDISGVFEFSWLTNEPNILVTALAEGPPKLFQYTENRLNILDTTTVECDEKVALEMTLAVSGGSDSFLTSDNKGHLRRWNLNGPTLEMTESWQAHSAEIWYVSQDRHNPSLFFTGSDDYSMKCWDIRGDSIKFPVAVNKTGHEAGVCCVVSSPFDEYTIASGSYDGYVRLWDLRAFRSTPTKSIECGSGAWRVAWNPNNRDEMAVAAMRAGFHVISLGTDAIVQTESVDDHVAYGIDWHPKTETLASCSFYNNQGQFFQYKK